MVLIVILHKNKTIENRIERKDIIFDNLNEFIFHSLFSFL